MENLNWKNSTSLILAVLLLLAVLGWHANGQARPPAPPPKRQWEYQYDTASNAFPSEADKAKIDLYSANGWELVTVVRGQPTVLVFKRGRSAG